MCYSELIDNVKLAGQKSEYRNIGKIHRKTGTKGDEFINTTLVRSISNLENALCDDTIHHWDRNMTATLVKSLLLAIGDIQIIATGYDWVSSGLDERYVIVYLKIYIINIFSYLKDGWKCI